MIAVQYPDPEFRIKKEEGKQLIFDPLRKLWLQLTEEEWVRQNFVQYLIRNRNYPPAYIAIEKMIRLHELKKRFDILVYNREHQPWMLVECKEPRIAISEVVLQQALRYHISVPASFIVITNGATTIGWEKKEGRLVMLDELPMW
jgi:hypothetical protein